MRLMTRMQRMALAPLLLLFALLFVYALALPKAHDSVRPIDAARFLAGEQAKVKALLLDPDSVRFRNAIVSTARPMPFACGELNVRGPTGGYTEFVRFVSGPTLRLVEAAPGSADMDRIWTEFCQVDAERAAK